MREEDEMLDRIKKRKLEEMMNLAKDSLEVKRKMLERFTDKGLYPYSRYYLRFVKEAYNNYWQNHFSTVGLIGMNEACLNLFGENIMKSNKIELKAKLQQEAIKTFNNTINNIIRNTIKENRNHFL